MNLRKNCMSVFIGAFICLLVFTWIFGSPVEAGDNWAHFIDGQKFLKQKRYSAARDNFSYYLRHPEMHARMAGVAHFGLGLLYHDMGRIDLAVKEYFLAIQNDLHPDNPVKGKAFMNLGTIYMKRKDYKDAIHVYSKAVEHNQRNGLAHYYLGLSYFKVSDYERAEKESIEAKRLGVGFTALSDKLAKRKELKKGNPEADAQSGK